MKACHQQDIETLKAKIRNLKISFTEETEQLQEMLSDKCHEATYLYEKLQLAEEIMSEGYSHCLNQHVIYTTRVKHLEELQNKVWKSKSISINSQHRLEHFMMACEDLTQQLINLRFQNQNLKNELKSIKVRLTKIINRKKEGTHQN